MVLGSCFQQDNLWFQTHCLKKKKSGFPFLKFWHELPVNILIKILTTLVRTHLRTTQHRHLLSSSLCWQKNLETMTKAWAQGRASLWLAGSERACRLISNQSGYFQQSWESFSLDDFSLSLHPDRKVLTGLIFHPSDVILLLFKHLKLSSHISLGWWKATETGPENSLSDTWLLHWVSGGEWSTVLKYSGNCSSALIVLLLSLIYQICLDVDKKKIPIKLTVKLYCCRALSFTCLFGQVFFLFLNTAI